MLPLYSHLCQWPVELSWTLRGTGPRQGLPGQPLCGDSQAKNLAAWEALTDGRGAARQWLRANLKLYGEGPMPGRWISVCVEKAF
jgi:hypothetical protein